MFIKLAELMGLGERFYHLVYSLYEKCLFYYYSSHYLQRRFMRCFSLPWTTTMFKIAPLLRNEREGMLKRDNSCTLCLILQQKEDNWNHLSKKKKNL